jgi:hypothetical protein
MPCISRLGGWPQSRLHFSSGVKPARERNWYRAHCIWQVSAPAANLWLVHTPLFYKASRGRGMQFKLLYKNRLGTQGTTDNSAPESASPELSRWWMCFEVLGSEKPNKVTYFAPFLAIRIRRLQVQFLPEVPFGHSDLGEVRLFQDSVLGHFSATFEVLAPT